MGDRHQNRLQSDSVTGPSRAICVGDRTTEGLSRGGGGRTGFREGEDWDGFC